MFDFLFSKDNAFIKFIKSFFDLIKDKALFILKKLKGILIWILRLIAKIFLYLFAGFGFIIALILLIVTLVGFDRYQDYFAEQKTALPDNILLVAKLDKIFNKESFACHIWGRDCPLTLISFIEGLNQASADETVKGLIVFVNGASFPEHMGLAEIQAFRKAIIDFRKAGKQTWVYHNDLGSFGDGTMDYYFASAFSKIILAPSGAVGLSALKIETPFVAEALDRLKIKPDFETRHEYKGAVSSLLYQTHPEPQRDNMQALLDSLYKDIHREIGLRRSINDDDLNQAFERFAIPAEEALQSGFIDAISYRSEMPEWLKQQFNQEQPEHIGLSNYLSLKEKPKKTDDALQVAFIVARGPIVDYVDFNPPFNIDDNVITPNIFIKRLDKAVKNENIDAIILYISSPGGSYSASDDIWNAIRKAREKKPVVAMMGDVAASGGYFIAMAADQIIAQPVSLTGSIGVVAGSVAMREFFSQWGISFDVVTSDTPGGASGLNGLDPLEGEEKQAFIESIDRIYRDFTDKVARSRGMSEQEIDAVARGRIWSGRDAFENRLVDHLGGIDTAKIVVRNILDKPLSVPVELVFSSSFPDNPIDKIKFFLEQNSAAKRIFSALPKQSKQFAMIFSRDSSQEILRLPYFILTD